ncbi:hypothetical protein ACT4U9_02945 [Acinetobacter baumannii]|uniref:hypothetical protein n=1 Tax=Acinetobacter baumannii TaxID=470 RepID=UPI0037568887|nr:hypothetical protein [Acinetobacter baumannii]HCQ9890116.1 hypothetical protein [Acinetobacter baumannii]HCQ9892165.1 hypothetical protein [Acinetobacter baumannii]
MSERFLPLEIFHSSKLADIPAKLIFSDSNSIRYYKVELFRLLVGLSSFKCIITDNVIIQRKNFLYLPYKTNINLNHKMGRYFHIDTLLLEKNLGNQINRGFYDEILNEFYHYFYEISKGNQTTGFLHLYRILERIAIALPLVYAAHSNNYKGVYNDLKKFILDEKTGELAVLKKFIASFIEDIILDQSIDINFPTLVNDWHKNHFRALKKFNLQEGSNPNISLTYKFKNIIDLIIKTRNSYFHALTGANNSFTLDEVVHNDAFFEPLNPVFCNWLSYIILKIIKLEISRN